MFGRDGDVLLVVRREGVALREGRAELLCGGGDRGDWGDVRLVLARYENREFYG